MQFVAASKLKRAQDATLQSRPYADKIDEVLADLAAVLGGEDHPLLAEREGGTRLIVLITTDRGLAGSLNTNTIRFAVAADHRATTGTSSVVTVGRKGHAAMRRARVPIAATSRATATARRFADVIPLARLITDDFLAGTYSAIDLVYPRFVSTLVQRPAMRPAAADRASRGHRGHPGQPVHLRAEPGRVLRQLLPRYVATRLTRRSWS